MAGEEYLAQGIQNAASGLAKGIQTRQANVVAQKELLMKQAELAYKKLVDVRDTRFKLAVDPALPEEVRLQLWNQAASANNAISADFKMPSLDSFDPTAKAVSTALSERIQANAKLPKEEQTSLSDMLKEFEPVFAASVALAQSKAGREQVSDSQTAITKLLDSQMNRTAPEGAPFEINVEGKPTLGRANKQNEFLPITAGGNAVQKPPEALPGESGAKAAISVKAMEQLKEAKKLLFSSGGQLKRGEALKANLNIPSKNAQLIRKNVKAALEAKIRNESGAAIQDSELEREVDKYLPRTFDNSDVAKARLADLEDIFETYIYTLDPNGKLQLKPNDSSLETGTQPKGSGKIKTADDFFKAKGL